jgi:predicted metal-dependent HD superfamily phosphohydrolase
MTDGHLELRIAWERHIGDDHASRRWFDSVLSRYREPQRHYHDLGHLNWVVRHIESIAVGQPIVDLDAVVAAGFFHDVIYDPTRSDNEVASGRLAASALTELGWDRKRVGGVDAMIRATATHDLGGATVDDAVLFAADLAVLAAEPAGYSDYVRNVRREYGHVSDADWVTGRSTVLRSFLARAEIYAAFLGLDGWEQRARGNITAELGTFES